MAGTLTSIVYGFILGLVLLIAIVIGGVKLAEKKSPAEGWPN